MSTPLSFPSSGITCLTEEDLPQLTLEVARRADALRLSTSPAILSDMECWEQAESEVFGILWTLLPMAVA